MVDANTPIYRMDENSDFECCELSSGWLARCVFFSKRQNRNLVDFVDTRWWLSVHAHFTARFRGWSSWLVMRVWRHWLCLTNQKSPWQRTNWWKQAHSRRGLNWGLLTDSLICVILAPLSLARDAFHFQQPKSSVAVLEEAKLKIFFSAEQWSSQNKLYCRSKLKTTNLWH